MQKAVVIPSGCFLCVVVVVVVVFPPAPIPRLLVTSKSQHVTHTKYLHTRKNTDRATQSTTTQTQCADALGYIMMKEKFLYSSSEAGA